VSFDVPAKLPLDLMKPDFPAKLAKQAIWVAAPACRTRLDATERPHQCLGSQGAAFAWCRLRPAALQDDQQWSFSFMLVIRPANSAEAQDLARIGLNAWERAIRLWGEDADRLRDNARNAYYDFCTRCWPDILVAEWDGDLAGWGASEKADDFITDLWVAPGFQGRGIGTALLEAIEAGIRERGYTIARLDTHARNAGAIKLYKRLGYRVKSYFVSYSAALDEDIDKVEMIKEFEPGAASKEAGPEEDGLYGI
jgi:ribosomal-protein-alanine N-acetyltransferase